MEIVKAIGYLIVLPFKLLFYGIFGLLAVTTACSLLLTHLG